MSVQHFPAQFSLKSLKNQAKQLLKAQGNGAYDAWERIKALHPKLSPTLEWSSADHFSAMDFSLQDAQLVVAREYGFPSWPRLVAAVTATQEKDSHEPASDRPESPPGNQVRFAFKGSFDLDVNQGPSVRDVFQILFRDDVMVLLVGLPGKDYYEYSSRTIACEYTLAGEFVRQVGRVGTGVGEYDGVYNIALDPSGNLYVNEKIPPGRITVYDENGAYVEHAERGEHLPYTEALAFDAGGNLLQLSDHDGIEEDNGVYKCDIARAE